MKKWGLIVLSILLIVLFWQFDFSGFISSIRQVPLLAFIALLMIQVISQLLVNYQWCRIGKIMGGEYNFFRMLYVNARGAIIESVTPGVKVGGEVTRALLLKNELKYSVQEAATLVTIQKIVSFSSFFVINLFAFAHISNKIEIFQGSIVKFIVYFCLIALISTLAVIFACTSFLEKRIMNISTKHKWTGVIKRYMMTVLLNIKVLKQTKGEMFKQLLLSFIIWLLFPAKMILLVRLFTVNCDWVFLTEVTFISYMVGMIPLLPGGLGSFEATMASLLIAMQINSSEALAITLLFRFITFWFVILISLLYVGIWKVKGGGKMKSTRLKHLPNALTLCNMAIGILVVFLMIYSSSLSSIRLACFLIYIAVIFDMLDGRFARYLNSSSELGKQLDSFADFVSFGIAPTAIFASGVNNIPWYMMIVLLAYPLAGGFRLARYNLQENSGYFIGLPITAAGCITTTALLVNCYFNNKFTSEFITFYLLIIAALSVLMVSRFRVNRILKDKVLSSRKNNIKDITSLPNKTV